MTATTPLHLLGLAEVAAALGISREAARKLHERGKLPPPDAKLAMGPVWKVETIATYKERTNG